MADEGYPPVPPRHDPPPPQATVPPAMPTPPPAVPQAPQAYQPVVPSAVYEPQAEPGRKRSRAWMWWTLGMMALLFLTVASCTLPFVFMAADGSSSFSTTEAIAVIRVDGVIAGTGDTYSGYVTPEHFLDQLDQAVEDESVKAIVLRVDSPGGTVAASEEISRYVAQCEKPIVVSIGDIGASGAYMISSQADQIMANAGSSVGSIGVISEIPNVSKLMDKVGVEFQVITAGKNKDTGSPFRPLTKEERALIQGEVNEAYGQFIDIVAKGRKMERSKVESLATGWVWSGEKALELGLIDKLGTYSDALDSAADKGGIDGDYDIITYDDEFGDIFGSLLGVSKSLGALAGTDASRESVIRRTVPR